MNLDFIKPQNLGSLVMKSSQFDFNLRLPGSYLVHSYPITTVHQTKGQWLLEFMISQLLKAHCNPVQGQYRARTGFSLCSISTQGKTCFHCRVPSWWKQVFPCWKYYTRKTLFSLQGWVCSAFRLMKSEGRAPLQQNTISLCTFPTQGKTCFHYRVPRWWKQVFPCWEKYTGKTLFSLQGWVCSVPKLI